MQVYTVSDAIGQVEPVKYSGLQMFGKHVSFL